MEHYGDSLKSAKVSLAWAEQSVEKAPPGITYLVAHDAIHNFVDALARFRGRRGKVVHRHVADLAQEMGLPADLVDDIRTVERGRNRAAYGGVHKVAAEEASAALNVAKRLASIVASVIPPPGERVAMPVRRADGVVQRYRVKRTTISRRRLGFRRQ